MSKAKAPPPAAKRKLYVYAVVDKRSDPPEIAHLEKTRRAAREKIQWSKDADNLRVKRGRLLIYER